MQKTQTASIFVDNCRDRNEALKKARKILKEKYPNMKRNIFSAHKQGYKKGRYVVWYKISKVK